MSSDLEEDLQIIETDERATVRYICDDYVFRALERFPLVVRELLAAREDAERFRKAYAAEVEMSIDLVKQLTDCNLAARRLTEEELKRWKNMAGAMSRREEEKIICLLVDEVRSLRAERDADKRQLLVENHRVYFP